MGTWGFWEWLTYGCIGIAALMLALDAAVKQSPDLSARYGSFLATRAWAFTPFALILVSGLIIFFRQISPPYVVSTQAPVSSISPPTSLAPPPQPTNSKPVVKFDILTVSNAKIAEIAVELRKLPLDTYPHSIAVLFRVFLEQSTDHYLAAAGISLTVTVKGHTIDKKLRFKVDEAITQMVKKGAVKKDLAGISKALSDAHNPLHPDTLNNYVHNRFYSPTERDLKVAWDNAQLYFENIWK